MNQTKKKILAIDQGDHIGGAERFLSDLLTRVDQDYEVVLLCNSNPEYLDRYHASTVRSISLEIPRIAPSPNSLLRMSQCKKALQKLIKEEQPDLILSNTVRTQVLISALAKKHHIPLLWMAHDLTFPKFLLKRMLKYPDHVICCSKEVEAFIQQGSKDVSTSVLYPFGIDEPDDVESKEKTVGMIGKFIPWKAQDLFISAAIELSKKFPDWSFEIIGSPYKGNPESEQFYQKCRQMIADAVTKRVSIKASENAQEEARKWSILVHCSTRAEPLGRVILEGMQAGCAVIASNLGGPKELIVHEHNGLLISPQKKELIATVRRLIDDKELRTTINTNAQVYVQEHFLWKNQIQTFREILEKLQK